MVNLKEKLLAGWLGSKLLKQGNVIEVENLGACYRRLTVHAPLLRDAPLGAGDKVQVFLPGIGTRTYTPFAFQPQNATFVLLAYLHASGPGSAWAGSLQVGDALRFIGPQGSLPLAAMAAPVALLGDETSLAVASASFELHRERALATLEVEDMDSAREACARLGLSTASLVARTSDDRRYAKLAERLRSQAGATGTLALTGSAQTIQAVRAELRAQDSKSAQKSKAYWSRGKSGLD